VRALAAIYQATVPWVTIIVRRVFAVAGAGHANVQALNLRYAWASGGRRVARDRPGALDGSPESDHTGHMKPTGVAELKAHLSRYLDQVKSGQEVVITEHGRPVAKLVPLHKAERRDARRSRLARAGLLQLGSGRLRARLLTAPRGPRVGKGVLDALVAERGEAR